MTYEWHEMKIEGDCIRCEKAPASVVCGGNMNTGVAYGYCSACNSSVQAEDAAGLAAGRYPFGY